MKDKFGHNWSVSNGDHPFLTQWTCSYCKRKTTTHDGRIPADEPELAERCTSAPPVEKLKELSLESFLAESRQRDFWSEFKVYYLDRHRGDPEGWPLSLNPQEWLSEFTTFLSGLDG